MNCIRMHNSRMVDYSAITNGFSKLREAIRIFVFGILARRKNPVSEKQITRWFHGTPKEFVLTALAFVEHDGFIIEENGKYRIMTVRDKIQQEAR